MLKRFLLMVIGIFIILGTMASETRLLRQPSISKDHIAFAYGGDIWITGLDGGEAKRLTSFQGKEFNPKISPDGRWIAFSGQFAGGIDVFVISVDSGEIKQLTWHPGDDIVRGWSPEGKVVFTSTRESPPIMPNQDWSYPKFFEIGFEDGLPEALPIPMGYRGEHSPDGQYFAYELVMPVDEEWRNYRGGQNRPIWVLNMKDYSLEELPQVDNSRNQYPVWVGNTIYFLSDRDYNMNLYSYDRGSRKLEQLTFYSEFDIKYLSSGGGLLVYEYGGYIYKYDPLLRKSEKLTISVQGDFPWAMPSMKNVSQFVANVSSSPNGEEIVLEARGDIFILNVKKNNWKNLTNSPGVRDRFPIWSPSGKSIAWFSDETGEYRLMIGAINGLGKPLEIPLPEPNFNYTPVWSPDSSYIIYTDCNSKLWLAEIKTGNVKLIDHDRLGPPAANMVWSPDSKWIAYGKRQTNRYSAIMVYSLEKNEAFQLTDGMSDAIYPAWDASGKYIWFLASTNYGINTGWMDMSAFERPYERAVYLIVLNKDDSSPLLPGSDMKKAGKMKNVVEDIKVNVKIDFEDIYKRILPVDVPVKNYTKLLTGGRGIIFYMENVSGQPGSTLYRYELEKREAVTYLSPIHDFEITADHNKLLYGFNSTAKIVSANVNPSKGERQIDISHIQSMINPALEWRQIFKEAWRIYRDYLYVANFNGADWDKVYERYEPFIDYIKSREDLNYLLGMMEGEVSTGHTFVKGGDMPDIPQVNTGLLGADLEIENGFYRIKKIYTGESWNPGLRGPLSSPGLKVSAGDYILAVDGVDLKAPINYISLLSNKANKLTELRINSKPDYSGSWLITIVPVSSEVGLRQQHWVEENRRKVNELSDGKLAYVFIPNTRWEGYVSFNRYYFAQQDKQGVIIDERFNGGGQVADYMIDIMARTQFGSFRSRAVPGQSLNVPAMIHGPKVMIINEHSCSGGDLLAYVFKKKNLGPIVGKTTWGGLIAIWDYPLLIDGGQMIPPRGGFFNTNGEWCVEGIGVAPDIEVEMIPEMVIKGHDPQLERAVEEALRFLKENPVDIISEPKDPVRIRRAESKFK